MAEPAPNMLFGILTISLGGVATVVGYLVLFSPPPPIPTKEHDALSLALLQARRDLWKNPPRCLPVIFGPLREFFLDPGITIAAILLPRLFPRESLLNKVSARLVLAINVPLIQLLFYRRHSSSGKTDKTKETLGFKAASKQALACDRTCPGAGRVVLVDPPSFHESALLGVISFVVSVVGDILGAFTNPKKYQSWMDALTQLQSYLVSTGVANELHQAIVLPLIKGRLLVNVKILSDIQASHLCLDRARAAVQEEEKGEDYTVKSTPPNPKLLKDELTAGHKWMRFATAAYGTEMIRSALDREVDQQAENSERILVELESSIAFHCQIPEKDILLVYTDTEPDKHTLHHFLAVDHDTKSIVLALRGTLSLSGAIVDVQGMAKDYCQGKAHCGMAEMADNIWAQSGEKILEILNEDGAYKGYTFVITGHSLGAGTACLLNLKLHVEGPLGKDWPIRCYAFAPPPTFLACNDNSPIVDQAIQHTIAYIHDNDVVPHLSVSAVRRLAFLFNEVDEQSRQLRFWKRWRIFYDYEKVPQSVVTALTTIPEGRRASACAPRAVEGACDLIIPARVVVWCQETQPGQFEAYSCDPSRLAQGHIFFSLDMLTDHLPEQYEDALDALVEALK